MLPNYRVTLVTEDGKVTLCVFVSQCVSESWFMYSGWMVGCSGLTAVTLSRVHRSSRQFASPCLSLPA